jgi:branched-chain amino acid transport system substrate-binding protein
MAKAARDAGIRVTDEETVDKGTNDFGAILDRLKAGTPDQVVTILGPFTAGFFKAYEVSGWKMPLTGRINFLCALAAVSRQFTDSGSLSGMTSITVFTPEQQTPEIKDFVAAYRSHYGLTPNQRSFFVYNATLLVADAIRRARSDEPAAIQQATKTTTMPRCQVAAMHSMTTTMPTPRCKFWDCRTAGRPSLQSNRLRRER